MDSIGFTTAKEQASSFFRPLIFGVNAFYLILRHVRGRLFIAWTLIEILSLACIGAIQIYAYHGIVERSAQYNNNKSSSNSKALAGGGYLDALAFAFVIQFAALCFSYRFYVLLLLFPIWGAVSMYQTLGNSMPQPPSISSNTNTNNSNTMIPDRKPTKTEKRQQRQKQM
jgi:hypothetical protein